MKYAFRIMCLSFAIIFHTIFYVLTANSVAHQPNSNVPISSSLLEHKKPNLFIVYIVFGYAGAGKGTFAQTLQDNGYVHISLGDFLRKQLKRKTPLGLKYEKEINSSGGHIPEKLIDPIIYSEIKKLAHLKEVKGIILDGYPISIEQANNLETFLKKQKINYQIRPLLLEITKANARERILNREICENCSKIYNKRFNPPQKNEMCDKCGGKLVRRLDITEENIQNKFKYFDENEKTMITYYEKKLVLLKIDTNRKTEDNIREFIKYAK